MASWTLAVIASPTRVTITTNIVCIKKTPPVDGVFFCIQCVYLLHTVHRITIQKGMDAMESLRKTLVREDVPPDPVIVAIREICARIDAVQSRFDMETDSDLIEGCIYELESLRAQYRYLLRKARNDGVACREKAHLWGE